MQLIVAIIFVLITGPLSSHMIMKAAYNIKTPYTKKTKVDEISEDLKTQNCRLYNKVMNINQQQTAVR